MSVSAQHLLLYDLKKKVEDFHFDHGVYPNAILLSMSDVLSLGEMDRSLIKQTLPTITSLIPVVPLAFDLPLPVLLPVVATRLQKEQAIILENRDL